MIVIDGSDGEGGGQVLRTSLSCSLLTQQPFRLENIRAKRDNPGLQAQHLTCVRAAAAVGKADTTGTEMRSLTLTFTPKKRRGGDFRFTVKTAGATGLVAQTVVLPIAFAGGGTAMIEGGTHVIRAPSAHYLTHAFFPACDLMGLTVTLDLQRPGFFPRGGGCVNLTILPAGTALQPLVWTERGEFRGLTGIVLTANLPDEVAERAETELRERTAPTCRAHEWPSIVIDRDTQMRAANPGGLVALVARWERAVAMAELPAERGKRAETLAHDVSAQLQKFLDDPPSPRGPRGPSGPSGGGLPTLPTVDEYLADQLLLPCALAAGVSQFRTTEVTGHLLTNADVLRRFLPVKIDIPGRLGEKNVLVTVHGVGYTG